MRKLMPVILAVFYFCCPAIGQDKTPPPEHNPVVLSTYEWRPISWGDTTFRHISIDSLLNFYMDKGVRPNPLYKNLRMLRHRWGADSYKFILIYEIDKLENLEKADQKTTELIDATFKNEKDKDKFWSLWGRLFDRHEDSIMEDMVKPKM